MVEHEEEDEDVRENKLGSAFKGVEASQVLTISEVNALLKRYVEGQRQDDPNYQVHPMLSSTLAYAERFASVKNPNVTEEIRKLLVEADLQDPEFSFLSNIMPETAEEAKTLQPTLQSIDDERIQALLDDMAKYKKFE